MTIRKRIGIPAKLYGYFGLCRELLENMKNVRNHSESKLVALPLVSSLTNKVSPQGLINSHLSFLKY